MSLVDKNNNKTKVTDLKVDDNGEDEDGGHEVHEVGEVLAVERLAEAAHLVLAGGQQVEESDDGALKLGSCTKY